MPGRINKKPMSVKAFAEMLKTKNKKLGKNIIKEFEENSFADLAKQKVNLLLGTDGQA